MKEFKITTDASTIAVFDLEALRHRIDSDGDWWTYEGFQELKDELGNNNLVLINTGFDGTFLIKVEKTNNLKNHVPLNCPSGRLYIVCGEEIPGEGLVPELLRGGEIIEVCSKKVNIGYVQDGRHITIEIWG
jgi:hypothetical protein